MKLLIFNRLSALAFCCAAAGCSEGCFCRFNDETTCEASPSCRVVRLGYEPDTSRGCPELCRSAPRGKATGHVFEGANQDGDLCIATRTGKDFTECKDPDDGDDCHTQHCMHGNYSLVDCVHANPPCASCKELFVECRSKHVRKTF